MSGGGGGGGVDVVDVTRRRAAGTCLYTATVDGRGGETGTMAFAARWLGRATAATAGTAFTPWTPAATAAAGAAARPRAPARLVSGAARPRLAGRLPALGTAAPRRCLARFRGSAERWEKHPARPVTTTVFVLTAIPATFVGCGTDGPRTSPVGGGPPAETGPRSRVPVSARQRSGTGTACSTAWPARRRRGRGAGPRGRGSRGSCPPSSTVPTAARP